MRSSKSTWVWPGACSGRFQSWCGSMSSGRMIFGSAVFFSLAIDFFPGRLFAEREVCHAAAKGSALIGFYARRLDQLGVRLELLLDHRLEIGQRHAQGIDAQLEKFLAHLRRVHRRVEFLRCARNFSSWASDRKSTRLNSSHITISYAV